MRGCGPLSPRQANEPSSIISATKIHLCSAESGLGQVESITGFLLDAIRKNFANPEYAQERQRHEVWKRSKVNKKRKHKTERLEGRRQRSKKRRDEALRETCEELARMFPKSLKLRWAAFSWEINF